MSEKSNTHKAIESLREMVVEAFGDNLVSIVQYGAFEVSKSDASKVHVLIVVHDIENADWRRMSEAFDRLRGRASVVPMLLTEKSLRSSTDIFPILIHEMKKKYQIVHGLDIVSELQVERSHLRLRCEQELRSLQLQMQSACLMHFASPHRLRAALTRDYESFQKLGKIAFDLDESQQDSDLALLKVVALKFELDERSLWFAREFAEGRGEFDEESFGSVYISLMTAVRMAANYADQLPDA